MVIIKSSATAGPSNIIAITEKNVVVAAARVTGVNS